MKKIEFSKQIFLYVSLMVSLVIVFSFILMWRANDLTPLSFLIPAVFTEFAAATVFYFHKAKMENKIKLMKTYEIDVDKEDFKDY